MVQASKDTYKAFTTSTADQRIAKVDTYIDSFEERVYKRLAKAQPTDLSTFC